MGVSELFQDGKKPNLLFIITDQERSLQHWPTSFTLDNLPAMTRLQKHGLEFTQYFTNSCMCSPSRATLLTSQFPVQTGVTSTGSPEPRVHLPKDLENLATVLNKVGYHCEWHGKWHLGGGGPSDYGFKGWRPPDAGNYLSLNDTLGGGTPDNDGRYLTELCNFLDNPPSQPFCLVASLVNPHDVYVAQHDLDPALGYTQQDFSRVQVPLPDNYLEDPDQNNKPRAHTQMSLPYIPFANAPQDYVNFYAYLHTVVDAQIGQLLDRLDHHNLINKTLIFRTSDHGEQALSHSLVEKFYNAYEESIHVPLIVSNPIAFPHAQTTDALACHLDLIPTLSHLLGVDKEFDDCFYGKDLTTILDNPDDSVQTSIHFTYDDIPCRGSPSIVRCLRNARYKYAVYFTPNGDDADWELYDLVEDPKEDHNLAGQPSFADRQQGLDRELQQTMRDMKTLPAFAWPPKATKFSRGAPPFDKQI